MSHSTGHTVATTGEATHEATGAGFDVPPLKGPLRVREARLRITMLEQVLRDGEVEGTELCKAFTTQFPQAPAKLVRFADRTLTFYRWRQSSARRWGNQGTSTFQLTSDTGQEVLAKIPESARQVWLRYEKRRIYLNTRLSLAAYEMYRLQEWIDVLAAIKTIETDGIGSVTE